MFTKITAFSLLFASSALAAPTSSRLASLKRRDGADRCDAHIYLDTSNGLELANPTAKWKVEIVDSTLSQVGGWEGTNPPDIQISTTKGHNFVIEGKPATMFQVRDFGADEFKDSLTLSYDTQKWNGRDCRHFVNKSARASNGMRNQFDWWCSFDCPSAVAKRQDVGLGDDESYGDFEGGSDSKGLDSEFAFSINGDEASGSSDSPVTEDDMSDPSYQDHSAPDAEGDFSSVWDVTSSELDGEQDDEDQYASDSE